MNKSGIRVFIVDDDVSISNALREIIKNMGFQPVVCPTAIEVLNQFRIQGGHLAIIDCLLPKMPGVELAKNIKSEFGENIPVILSSGVYKDKGFIKDALQQTGAVGFFSKPFQVPELQDMVNKVLEGKYDEDPMPLENLLTTQYSPIEKIQEINNLKRVDAYDIPWLCCLIMNSSITGVLKLQTEKEKMSISFYQGRIVRVEMQNPRSFFGALLIEKGYATSDQIEQALAQKNSKRVGERLTEMNVLSPHVISIINSEQMAIRLSKIINDAAYDVSFAENVVTDLPESIDSEAITPFLIDWLNSKIPVTWIKQRYLKWLNSPPMRSPVTQTYQRLWSLPPLKNVPDLIADFSRGATLSQTLAKSQSKEDLVYQVFHLLLIVGYLQLKREIKPLDEIAQISRLHKIAEDMKTQDYFAQLGIGRASKSTEIKKTYYELAKIFHPDKIPGNASQKLKELAQNVFSQMTRAYETLSDDAKRTDYLKEIEMGRAEKILQAEGILEDAKALLKLGQAAKALQQFEKVLQLRPPNSEILIHYAWAKMLSGTKSTEDRLVDVEAILNKIPPEDRHNAIYYFVKAMYQKMIGDEAPAKKNLANALALNPKFVDAQRLLRTFDTKKKGGADIFRGDIKDVVGNLFSRKK